MINVEEGGIPKWEGMEYMLHSFVVLSRVLCQVEGRLHVLILPLEEWRHRPAYLIQKYPGHRNIPTEHQWIDTPLHGFWVFTKQSMVNLRKCSLIGLASGPTGGFVLELIPLCYR
jgi:hypothetical protein